MQKIFKKYTIIIMTIAILSILVVNFFFSAHTLEYQQYITFQTKIDQVIHTIKNNNEELKSIKENLDEDYLTRAKAAAYVVQNVPGVLDSVEELQNLARLLDVDEVHVTNSDGIIRYSSVPEYVGLDFHGGKQMRGFLPILESDSEDEYIIQEAQPNTAEGKMMKYVGVSRKGVKGLVQVGLEPVRQMEAQERNTYEYIFSRFPTDVGEEFFAVDTTDSSLAAYTEEEESELLDAYGADSLKECSQGAYRSLNNKTEYYIVTKQYGDVLIGASIQKSILYRTFWKNMLLTCIYLLAVEILAVILLNYLVKQKVVKGIHEIQEDLTGITNGELNTKVEVGGNPEFEDLSRGINTMVKSIASTSDRISKIISMSEIPLAAFEFQSDMNYVFVTSRLRELLDMTEGEMHRITAEPDEFLRMVKTMMEKSIAEDEDVYCINPQKYIRFHLTVENGGYYGAVTDVTREIVEKHRMLYENNHDQLTGLCRYSYFKQKVALKLKELKEDEVCACVMIDLDCFKKVNDTYGHDIGDKYLQEFARLMKALPEGNCVVSRRSGDEFCIFVYGYKDKREIQELLRKFWNSLEDRRVRLNIGEECFMSASGGYVCEMSAGAELKQMLKQADEALYEVKRENKGHFKEYKNPEDRRIHR